MAACRYFLMRTSVAVCCLGAVMAVGPWAQAVHALAVVELSPTPPAATQRAAPNIVLTMDNSGTMLRNVMGDRRPFDDKPWGSDRWLCAGVIDPRVTRVDDIRAWTMNGVYYNPNVLYLPPMRANGSSFPDADAMGGLARVPVDGIAVNRPRNRLTLDAIAKIRSNPPGSTPPRGAADLVGIFTPRAGGKRASDLRWSCLTSEPSPMDGKTVGPDGRPYPNGGPYYYRYKDSAPPLVADERGVPTSDSVRNLYRARHWEAVAVRDEYVTIDGVTVNARKNFANWFAYYRTRDLAMRTVLSRILGQLGAPVAGGGYGSPFRLAWQSLYASDRFHLQDSAIISSLMDANSPVCDPSSSRADPLAIGLPSGAARTPPNCYRSAFFNWLFDIDHPPIDDTPARAATIRAGEFFRRKRDDLHSPYWQPEAGGGHGQELSCRQNFHMLVTDGYWRGKDPNLPASFKDSQTAQTLPDGTIYSTAAAESRVYWDVQGPKYTSSLSNIAFHYWATNLRPDLYTPAKDGRMPPYMQDTTTGVVRGATSPLMEQYFNPRNDPARWPHLVQYMVTLGVAGTLNFSDDAHCASPNDLCALRQGRVNSSGAVGWTRPVRDGRSAADDTWHAAINSRGAYFSAASPQSLVDRLGAIFNAVKERAAAVTSGAAVNASVLVPGALGFSSGYDPADWSGSFKAMPVDAMHTGSALAWDAGALLDDERVTDPGRRHILTSRWDYPGRSKGVAFKFLSELDIDARNWFEDIARAGVWHGDGRKPDAIGQDVLNYLRGDRGKEGSVFRQRKHRLGAIIGSQAVYVGRPSGGYRESWPANAPEREARGGYEAFVRKHLGRTHAVYVGANDGMLHAFDASMAKDRSGKLVPALNAGKELFAYVPRSVYVNLRYLTRKDDFKFVPTVDGAPVTRDVYFSRSTTSPVATSPGWRTILVGGLRLGGRGVYALDVTDPASMDAGKVLWEFHAHMRKAPVAGAGDPANLGYTYGQPNIGRLNNGKWVVLVPGGYFPDCAKANFDDCHTPPAAANTFSSLFVLDAQTGELIRELKTSEASSDITSHGLASPVLGDYNDDQVDDVAFAGDLDGNLWRYDFSSSDPKAWTVRLAYHSYLSDMQPITTMPRLFPDPATGKFIVVFGTGKYLGAGDAGVGSTLWQSVYGIRDTGRTVSRSELVSQDMYERSTDDGKLVARGLTDHPVPADKGGWYFDFVPSASATGERVVVTPAALFDSGRVVIQTLIPGRDPCDPRPSGALMVVNAANGGSGGGISALNVSRWTGSAVAAVGARIDNPRSSGTIPVVSAVGGGRLLIPGLTLSGSDSLLNIDDAIWRRRSWRRIVR